MRTSTSERIRRGAGERLAAAGTKRVDRDDGAILARVAALSRGARLRLAERDQLLYLVVRRYRDGSRDFWGPVVLEVLAAPLMARLTRFSSSFPAIDEEDISQQFLMEALACAATIPLSDHRYLERRLLLRASDRVSRYLQREARLAALVTTDPDAFRQ